MALGHPLDLTQKFNTTYNIVLDMSGWDKTTIQTEAPMGGAILVSATNDPGATQGVTQGNATLATNFSTVQVTNLATGVNTVAEIYGAGLFKYDVNARFLKLSGTPAAAGTFVYGLLLFHSKID